MEIEDNEGEPIKVNNKFRENHKNMDVSRKDVELIRNTLFKKSKQNSIILNNLISLRKGNKKRAIHTAQMLIDKSYKPYANNLHSPLRT